MRGVGHGTVLRLERRPVLAGFFDGHTGRAGTTNIGGGDGDRTHYLLHAMQALYQLSYAPIGGVTLPVDRFDPTMAESRGEANGGNYSPARDGAR